MRSGTAQLLCPLIHLLYKCIIITAHLRSHALRRGGQIQRLHAAAVRPLPGSVLREEVRVRENGLHVHGLPDGPGFDVFIGKHVHHPVGRNAAGGIDGDAGKPVVGLPVRVHGIHGNGRDIREGLPVLPVDLLFFPLMLFDMHQLASADPRSHVGHAIIKAQLGMLIVAGRVPGLGGKEPCLIHIFLIGGNQHAAA